MKINSRSLLALSLMVTLAATPVLAMEQQEIQPENARWSSASTIAAGVTVGAANGILSTLTDAYFPFNWLLLSELKSIMNRSIVNDARRAGEQIDTELLSNTSWISSWVAYILAHDKMPRPARVERTYVFVV